MFQVFFQMNNPFNLTKIESIFYIQRVLSINIFIFDMCFYSLGLLTLPPFKRILKTMNIHFLYSVHKHGELFYSLSVCGEKLLLTYQLPRKHNLTSCYLLKKSIINSSNKTMASLLIYLLHVLVVCKFYKLLIFDYKHIIKTYQWLWQSHRREEK